MRTTSKVRARLAKTSPNKKNSANNSQGLKTVWPYDHLISTRPHDIRQVMISDLHLSVEEPALVQAFSALLDDLIALPSLHTLYILGDWFDIWLGDDTYLNLTVGTQQDHWLTPLIKKLRRLNNNGCQILVMHGNRDFLIGQALCDTFNGKLIKEPYIIRVGEDIVRLEHGDALCTDDIDYQRMRRVLRSPVVKWGLLKQSLAKRQQLGQKIQQKSSADKTNKSADIMDVNEQAVNKALKRSHILLHGHTHRPDIHLTSQGKRRYVLGDWRLFKKEPYLKPSVEAVIGVTLVDEDTIKRGFREATWQRIKNKINATKNEQLYLARFKH